MKTNNVYFDQARLVVKLLAFFADQEEFALKGGTAINMFFRDFPRFSVDIDLVYLLNSHRDQALPHIHSLLEEMATQFESTLVETVVTRAFKSKSDSLRLVVESQGVSVKVELSPVLRGTVFPVERRPVVERVEEMFGYADMNVASFEDVFAGKLCAALDRQHPRDLFDVWLLLGNEGISSELRRCLVVYLISHPRPLEDLLRPNAKDVSESFYSDFDGMTDLEFGLQDLVETQGKLFELVPRIFDDNEREFLTSLYSSSPKWELLELDHVKELPAVKWKLLNVAKMPSEKRLTASRTIEEILQ